MGDENVGDNYEEQWSPVWVYTTECWPKKGDHCWGLVAELLIWSSLPWTATVLSKKPHGVCHVQFLFFLDYLACQGYVSQFPLYWSKLDGCRTSIWFKDRLLNAGSTLNADLLITIYTHWGAHGSGLVTPIFFFFFRGFKYETHTVYQQMADELKQKTQEGSKQMPWYSTNS
jgi:hypothetical protein